MWIEDKTQKEKAAYYNANVEKESANSTNKKLQLIVVDMWSIYIIEEVDD